MNHPGKAILAAAALLTLAACSATHVGESWQCPLAQGPGCATVAEADPALPRETAKTEPVSGEPLYRPRGARATVPASGRGCGGDCAGGFDPFAWLAGLFRAVAGEEDDASPAPAVGAEAEGAVAASAAPALAGAEEAPSSAPLIVDATDAGAPARLPADAGAASATEAALVTPLPPAPAAADAELREPEVIGRIWIAPFVDTDGHYREGAWVRTVLEPAGWRAP